jgi:predicted nucleic acid-binding protein
MIVIDSTVLIDFWAGDASCKASADALMLEDPDWVSVGLWRYEVGHVLNKYVRTGKMSAGRARTALLESEGLLIETVEEVDLGEIWDISQTTGLTYYDSSFVWLAQVRGLRLRTRDEKILLKCPQLAEAMPKIVG